MFNLTASLKKLELQIRKVVRAIKISKDDVIDKNVVSVQEAAIISSNKVVRRRKRKKQKNILFEENTFSAIKSIEEEASLSFNSNSLSEKIGSQLIAYEPLSTSFKNDFFLMENKEPNQYKISSSIQPLPKGLITIVNIYSKTS